MEHPFFTQERTYAIDYIKNFNSLVMKEITILRASIMRRNAHLVDWLADNFGATQMQMIHKKPAPSDTATATVTRGNVTQSKAQGPVFLIG